MGDFTSNLYIQPGRSKDYPAPSKPMDPADHPATNIPTATEDHKGSQLGYGEQGYRQLKNELK